LKSILSIDALRFPIALQHFGLSTAHDVFPAVLVNCRGSNTAIGYEALFSNKNGGNMLTESWLLWSATEPIAVLPLPVVIPISA